MAAGESGAPKALVIGVGDFAGRIEPGEETPVGESPRHPLPFALPLAERVATALNELDCAVDEVRNPKRNDLTAALTRVEDQSYRLVYVISHGERSDRDPNRLDVVPACGTTGVGTNVGEWISAAESAGRPTLFLLDLCHAGIAARSPFMQYMQHNHVNALVIAAAGPEQAAYDGWFSQAVVEALDEVRRNGLDTHSSKKWVSVSAFARRVRQLTHAKSGSVQAVVATALDLAYDEPELELFRNTNFVNDPQALAREGLTPSVRPFLDAYDADHFRDRAGPHFHGRTEQLQLLAEWLQTPGEVADGGLRVVTGKPGAGKSAVLGALACALHPELILAAPEVMHQVRGQAPAAVWPSAGMVGLAAVHARQRSLAMVIDSIGRQLGLRQPARGWVTDEFVDALARLSSPPAIILDALDEATDFTLLTEELLLPLAERRRGDRRPVCRLLVAMRPWEEFARLREAAEARDGLVNLDKVSPDELREALTGYLDAQLKPRVGVFGVRRELVGAAAERLTEESQGREWGAFLVAGIFARALEGGAALGTPVEARAVGENVPLTLPEVLDLDLDGRPNGTELRRVLAAAAHAKGEGMPAELIARVAGLDDSRTLELLHDDGARFYLRTAAERDGTTLYRLFHQGLADHLRGGATAAEVLHRLVGVRVAQTHGAAHHAPGDWDTAPPYLLRHAIEHAEDAERTDELLCDVEFLAHANAGTLQPAFGRAGSVSARESRETFLSSTGTHEAKPPSERREALAVDATRHGFSGLLATLTAGLPDEAWRPRWATGSEVAPGLMQETQLDSAVTALAGANVRGRPVAVLGGQDVRIWDLRKWKSWETCPPLCLPSSEAQAVTCAEIDGRVLVAAVGHDEVLVWDADTGAEHMRKSCDVGHVSQVVLGKAGEATIVALTGEKGLHAFHLSSGMSYAATPPYPSPPRNTLTRGLAAPTCVVAQGTVLAIWIAPSPQCPSDTFEGWVWEVASGRVRARWHLVNDYHPFFASHIAARAQEDGKLTVAAIDSFSTQAWSFAPHGPTQSQPVMSAVWHTHVTSAQLACITDSGRPLVVHYSWTGAVEAWTQEDPTQVGQLEIPTSERQVMAVVEVDGQARVVTGNSQGIIQIWDPTSERHLSHARPMHYTDVEALACSADSNGAIVSVGGCSIVWANPITGKPARRRLDTKRNVHGVALASLDGQQVLVAACDGNQQEVWYVNDEHHTVKAVLDSGPIRSIANSLVDGRKVLVLGGQAGAGSSGTVQVWDLETCQRIGDPMAGHPRSVSAVACTNLPTGPIAVTGSRDRTIRLWDLTTRTQIGEPLTGHRKGVRSLVCTILDGQPVAVSGSDDCNLRVWDLNRRECVMVRRGHTRPIRAIACTQLGGRALAFSGSNDRTVRTWDLDTGQCIDVLHLPGPVRALAVTDTGDLAIGAGREVIVMEQGRRI